MSASPLTESSSAQPLPAVSRWLARWRVERQLTQAELAKRSALSNKTVSEYERGKFEGKGLLNPDIVARLAYALDCDPHEAFEQAGLTYDEVIAEQARRKVQARRAETSVTAVAGHSFVSSLTELRSQKQARVRVSFIKEVCYSPFDKAHIQLLCKLINHQWDCEFLACETFSDKAGRLRRQPPERCHVAIGALETLERTASGLRFIPYPGLEQRLNAVISDAAPQDISWEAVVTAEKKKFSIVTISDEVGDQYMRGAAGYSADMITSIPRYNLDALNEVFVKQLDNQPPGKVVLVAAEQVCSQIIRRNRESSKLRYLVEPNKAEAEKLLPTYKPGLLVHYEDEEWYELLSKAQEFALLSAREHMVRLYAEYLVSFVSPNPRDQKLDHGLSYARLHDIGPLLRRDVRDDFLERLKRSIGILLKESFIPSEQQEAIVLYILALARKSSSEAAHEREEILGTLQQLYQLVRQQAARTEELQALVRQVGATSKVVRK